MAEGCLQCSGSAALTSAEGTRLSPFWKLNCCPCVEKLQISSFLLRGIYISACDVQKMSTTACLALWASLPCITHSVSPASWHCSVPGKT